MNNGYPTDDTPGHPDNPVGVNPLTESTGAKLARLIEETRANISIYESCDYICARSRLSLDYQRQKLCLLLLVQKMGEALENFDADSMFGRPWDTDCQVAYEFGMHSEDGSVLACKVNQMKECAQQFQEIRDLTLLARDETIRELK